MSRGGGGGNKGVGVHRGQRMGLWGSRCGGVKGWGGQEGSEVKGWWELRGGGGQGLGVGQGGGMVGI